MKVNQVNCSTNLMGFWHLVWCAVTYCSCQGTRHCISVPYRNPLLSDEQKYQVQSKLKRTKCGTLLLLLIGVDCLSIVLMGMQSGLDFLCTASATRACSTLLVSKIKLGGLMLSQACFWRQSKCGHCVSHAQQKQTGWFFHGRYG